MCFLIVFGLIDGALLDTIKEELLLLSVRTTVCPIGVFKLGLDVFYLSVLVVPLLHRPVLIDMVHRLNF